MKDISKQKFDFQARSYAIRDLWAGQDIGTTARPLAGSVNPHDVWMLRLRPR